MSTRTESLPVEQTLRYLGVELVLESREAWAKCPLHEEDTPSFHVDLVTGMWYCHGCQQGGGFQSLITKMVGDELSALGVIRRARRTDPGRIQIAPDGLGPLEGTATMPVDPVARWRRFQQVDWNTPTSFTPEADRVSRYMAHRGFYLETLQAFDVRLTGWEEYPVAFPILEKDVIAGYVRRRIDNDDTKRKYLYNAGLDAKERVAYFSVDDSAPCVVVEGVLDMMKCAQNGGVRLAALLGWRMNSAKARILRAFGVDEVVCATDNTPTGEQGWEQVRAFFVKAQRFQYPGEWVKDVGELSKHQFMGGMP